MPIPEGVLPAKRQVMADVLAARLLDEIVSGVRLPETVLSEKLLAEETGASRTPVREALDRLAAIDLVAVRPGKGTIVAPLDTQRHGEHLEVLQAILGGILRVVVPVLDAQEVRSLSVRLRQTRTGPDLFRADGFFEALVVVFRNQRVQRAWDALVPHVRRTWNIDPSLAAPIVDAGPMQSALEAGDGSAAVRVLDGWFAVVERTPRIGGPSAFAFDDVERGNLRQHAFTAIYDAIASGTLLPGEPIPEADLVRWLDMSRQPVRQALLQLADHELVELAPGKTPRVAGLDPRRTNERTVLSAFLADYAARRVVGRFTPERLVDIDDTAAAVERAGADGDDRAVGVGFGRFFAFLTEALGNSVLDTLANRIVVEQALVFAPGASRVDPAALQAPVAAMNAATQARDVDTVIALLDAMNAKTYSIFLAYRAGRPPAEAAGDASVSG